MGCCLRPLNTTTVFPACSRTRLIGLRGRRLTFRASSRPSLSRSSELLQEDSGQFWRKTPGYRCCALLAHNYGRGVGSWFQVLSSHSTPTATWLMNRCLFVWLFSLPSSFLPLLFLSD